MGNASGKSESRSVESVGEGKKKKGRKRKGGPSTSSHSKKVAKLNTNKYVYDKLFCEGEQSDITLCAFGREWKLHKFYLKQCEYFEALFAHEWRDSADNVFALHIPDERITAEGLHNVLASLYDNEISLELDKLESIVAAASLLQLKSVLSRASEAMSGNINDETVLPFATCSHIYGLSKVREQAFEYLKRNFWRLAKEPPFLSALPEEAMESVITSLDLLVCEGEADLYRIVKTWIYFQLVPGHMAESAEEVEKAVASFYTSVKQAVVDSACSSEAHSPCSSEHLPPAAPVNLKKKHSIFMRYSHIFAGLRLHGVLNTTSNIAMVKEDGILPDCLIDGVMAEQYRLMLQTDEARSAGAGEAPAAGVNDVSDESFHLSAMRFGRSLDALLKCWRWIGFNNGNDFLLNLSYGNLSIKRNCYSHTATYATHKATHIRIHYRLMVLSSTGECIADTGKKSDVLMADSTFVLLRGLNNLAPPFSVHLSILSALPPPSPSFLHIRRALSTCENELFFPLPPLDGMESSQESVTNEDSARSSHSTSSSRSSSDSEEYEL